MIEKSEWRRRGKKKSHTQAVICESSASVVYVGWHMHSRGPCHREFRRPLQCLCWQYDWWADTRADGPFTRHPHLTHTEGERDFLTNTHTHAHTYMLSTLLSILFHETMSQPISVQERRRQRYTSAGHQHCWEPNTHTLQLYSHVPLNWY